MLTIRSTEKAIKVNGREKCAEYMDIIREIFEIYTHEDRKCNVTTVYFDATIYESTVNIAVLDEHNTEPYTFKRTADIPLTLLEMPYATAVKIAVAKPELF